MTLQNDLIIKDNDKQEFFIKEANEVDGRKEFVLDNVDFENISIHEFMPFLNKAIRLLKPSTDSITLLHLKQQLTTMHESGCIWQILASENNFTSKLLQLYFSIPELCSAVFDLDPKDPISPRSFCKALADGYSDSEKNRNFLPLVISKSHRLNGIPVFVESIMKRPYHTTLIQHTLRHINAIHLEIFLEELCNYLSIYFIDIGQLARILDELRLPKLPDSHYSVEIWACWLYQHYPAGLDLVPRLIEGWSIKIDLSIAPLSIQRRSSRLLATALSFIDYDFFKAHKGLESTLIEGIQNRLDTEDIEVSTLGKVIAECYAKIVPSSEKLSFELEENSLVGELRDCFNLGETLYFSLGGLGPRKLHSWLVEKDLMDTIGDFDLTEPVITGSTSISSPPLIKIHEGEEEPRNAKIKPPKFLRDCITYLKCTEDPVKLELALTHCYKLVISSSSILIDEVGGELYKCLLYMSQGYDIVNFDVFRRENMSLLVAINPTLIGKIMVAEILGNGSSLRQKLDVCLACMSAIRLASKPQTVIGKKTENLMKLLTDQLGFPTDRPSKILLKPINDIIKNTAIPILVTLQNSNSRAFMGPNDLLLEKTLQLTAYSLVNVSSSEFPRLVGITLNFIKPLFHQPSLPRSVLKAVLLVFHSVLAFWQPNVPIIEYAEKIADCTKYLESQETLIMDLGDDYITLYGAALSIIEERCSPIQLIREAMAATG